jgi:hypothetical protein
MQYPFWPYPLDPDRPRNDIEVRFWHLHRRLPQIYWIIDRECKVLIAKGITHYGLQAFFESIRWDTGISMEETEIFKMNNDFPAYYARLWLQNNPDHWGFFELRRVKGEYPQRPPPPSFSFDPDGQGLLF